MKTSITKIFEFEAAHHLPLYDGKCRDIHGHTYKLEVTVSSQALTKSGPKTGMVMDFGSLKEIVKTEILDHIDHTDLNTIWPQGPTAEIVCRWIFEVLDAELLRLNNSMLQLEKVRLWETSTSYAEVGED